LSCLHFFYVPVLAKLAGFKARHMNFEKENFLRSKLVSHLQQLKNDEPARWGKMNVQQMIEHFTDVMMVASGKIKLATVTPADKLPRLREFMFSEKPFRENTKSPVLPEEPMPLKKHTKEAAIGKLQEEVIHFFEAFEKEPELKTNNPVFGELDFDANIQLLYKHALHHLKQFGIEVY
jgi:hypothetical protein